VAIPYLWWCNCIPLLDKRRPNPPSLDLVPDLKFFMLRTRPPMHCSAAIPSSWVSADHNTIYASLHLAPTLRAPGRSPRRSCLHPRPYPVPCPPPAAVLWPSVGGMAGGGGSRGVGSGWGPDVWEPDAGRHWWWCGCGPPTTGDLAPADHRRPSSLRACH
jgi:hypothetical protein